VYLARVAPPFLDPMACELLAEARKAFDDLGLSERAVIASGEGPWPSRGRGTRPWTPWCSPCGGAE